MGNVCEDIITILIGILFYTLSIISIFAIVYSYLKEWQGTRVAIIGLEAAARNPALIILVKVINYAKYLAAPMLVWGLYWYTVYAQATV